MNLWLAPMEGLLDASFRKIITSFGGIDIVVTEFVRVTQQLLPDKVFLRQIPELNTRGYTKAGTPVRVQLMGSDPGVMAESAAQAIRLGSSGIDINFGCPSRTVNSRHAGAALLKEPESIYRILSAVRQSVPKNSLISAKVRIGYQDSSESLAIAAAAQDSGCNQLIVHGRTKIQGYKPPADWETIGKINAVTSMTVVANGDIYTPENLAECQRITGCNEFMIGRGAVMNPWLPTNIKNHTTTPDWFEFSIIIREYIDELAKIKMPERYIIGRVKQLIKMMSNNIPHAVKLLNKIKTEQELQSIIRAIENI